MAFDRRQILGEIETERRRQVLLRGEDQGLPMVNDLARIGLESEDKARLEFRLAGQAKQLTYLHILREEFAEVVWAENNEARRAELIQLAAVCLQIIERIDDDSREKKSE